ncbi:hypothetical protein SNEBB_009496 [Seison nebaliae]|nr:hypothetical protein SNEBB_009496 [Seison nebaliae]
MLSQLLGNIRSSPFFRFVSTKTNLSVLRKKTGFSMKKCRDALVQFDDDIYKAESWLIEQATSEGWSKATKLENKKTGSGIVAVFSHGNTSALLELNCQTDFVAKSVDFQRLAAKILISVVGSYPFPDLSQQLTPEEETMNQKNYISTLLSSNDILKSPLSRMEVNLNEKFEEMMSNGSTDGTEYELQPERNIVEENVRDPPLPSHLQNEEAHVTHVDDLIAYNIGFFKEKIVPKRLHILAVPFHSNLSTGFYCYTSTNFVNYLSRTNLVQVGQYAGVTVVKNKSLLSTEIEEVARNISEHIVGMNPKTIETNEMDETKKKIEEDEDCLIKQEYLLDPSMTVGEYIRDKIDIEHFIRFGVNEEKK